MVSFAIVNAQIESCGVEYTENYKASYPNNINEFRDFKKTVGINQSFAKSSNSPKNNIAINIHIVTDDNGNTNLDTSNISKGINYLNKVFEDAGLEFYVCGNYNYINSTLYYNMHNGLYYAIDSAYGVPNSINMYFVRFIVHYGGGAAGVAPTPGGGDWIIIKNNVDSAVIAHEMGHFFGLLHTHGLLYDVLGNPYTEEYVDGSNCNETADYFCDTPADPGLHLTYGIDVNSQCQYIGNEKDSHLDPYNPDVGNLMSYAPNACLNHFSAEQSEFMLWNYLNRRAYLSCSDVQADFNYLQHSSCDSPYVFNFYNQSINLSNIEWDVDNDDITDYTSLNPSHTYAQAGNYWVRLKGTFNGQSYERFKPIKVQTPYLAPHLETMNNGIPEQWSIDNLDHGRKWEIVNEIAQNGSISSMWCFDNFAYTGYEERDAFYTKSYDLSNLTNARLSFDLAYAPHLACDSLLVYVSTDCGNTYLTKVLSLSDSSLISSDRTYKKFIPKQEDWKKIIIDLSDFAGELLSFKFENYNKGGNAIYIDNILVDGGNASKELGFSVSAWHFSEKGLSGINACRKYSDYKIPIFLSAVPDSVINLQIISSGTALNLVDYEIMTPLVSIDSGQAGEAFVLLRIYDDDASEAIETIQLEISILGSSDFESSSTSNTCLIEINDNEPLVPEEAFFEVVLINENFDNMQADTLPGWHIEIFDLYYSNTFWWSSSFWNSWIYDPYTSNFNNSLDSTNYMCISNYYSWNQVLCSTYLITPEFDVSSYDSLVLEFDQWLRNVPIRAGDLIVEAWNGSSWINFIRHSNSDGDIGGNFRPNHAQIPIVGFTNSDFKIRIGIENEREGFWYFMDNFQLKAYQKAKVASTLNQSSSAYLGPYDLVHFYDKSNGEIIASIKNKSNWDYGCTNIVIDREGLGAMEYNQSDSSYYATTKTIHVNPTNNNSNGEYDITMYFKEEELSTWIAQTGNSSMDMGLTKTAGPINAISPSNANNQSIYYASNIASGAYASIDYQIKGNFTQGFSGFAGQKILNTSLPVEYSRSLSGKNQGKRNMLQWTTALEINCEYFALERSENGIDFYELDRIPASGNNSFGSTYFYTDSMLAQDLEYYRLKQVDFDGEHSYSKIISLKRIHEDQAEQAFIYPNPVHQELNVVWNSKNFSILEILDTRGEILLSRNLNFGENKIILGDLESGYYLLLIKTNEGIPQIEKIAVLR